MLRKIRDFNTNGIAVRERFDAWYDSFDYFYEAKRVVQPDHPANWQHKAWHMGELLITTHDLGPFVGHHGTDQIKRFSGYDLLVRYVREGVQHSLHEDVPVVMKAGNVYVYRADREFSTLVKDRVKTIAIGLSLESDLFNSADLPNFLELDPNVPGTSILKNIMEMIEKTVECAAEPAQPDLDLQFVAILAKLLNPKQQDGSSRRFAIRARKTAMKSFVDRNFDKPGFDISQLLSAFGASRATIFRDFADDGGLQRYVISRRLDGAFDDLAKSTPSRGRVQQVAVARGFEDAGHFCRLFKLQYGITPSDAMIIGRLKG